MTRSIETLRQALDAIDAELLDQLTARQQVVDQIGLVKRAHQQTVRDEHRERAQRERIRRLAERSGLDAQAADALWQAILSHSRERQTQGPPVGTLTVAIQGQPESWSALALQRHLGDIARPLPCATFRDALAALRSGRAQLALLPVANSTIGPVRPAADLVTAPDLVQLSELAYPVRHCLATTGPVELSALTHVHSQRPALFQCVQGLRGLGLELVEEEDTAAAADVVQQLGEPTHAVLCSPEAAERRGLTIVARDLNDVPDNETTWTLLARRPGPAKPWRLSARHGRPDHVVQVGDVAIGGADV
ncbi:MAG: prephenate dehydratase domain-containing protein, partial [Myxococcota bacterium]